VDNPDPAPADNKIQSREAGDGAKTHTANLPDFWGSVNQIQGWFGLFFGQIFWYTSSYI